MLGLGSLTLPSVFARLGWAPALAVIAICALGTIYSGRLFTLLVEKASLPCNTLFTPFPSPALASIAITPAHGTMASLRRCETQSCQHGREQPTTIANFS